MSLKKPDIKNDPNYGKNKPTTEKPNFKNDIYAKNRPKMKRTMTRRYDPNEPVPDVFEDDDNNNNLPPKRQTLLGSTAPTDVDDLKPPKLKRHDGLDRRNDLEGRLQKLEKSKLDLEKRVAGLEKIVEKLDGMARQASNGKQIKLYL